MRFVNIKDRKFATVIFQFSHLFIDKYFKLIKYAKWNFHKWKGLTLMKDPMTLSTYMMMIQEIKPKTILEFGTYDGGSALWMEDITKSLGIDCEIYTFDINIERVNLPKESKIKFHQLDNYKIAEFIDEKEKMFKDLMSPILMIEDSHQNSTGLIRSMDKFLKPGDYLVIEDTLDQNKYEETILSERGIQDMSYEVDTHYCDLWGMNNSWNVNSILKKK